MSGPLESLRGERYVSLETFKKDGTGVKTPVWFAHAEEGLVVFTDGRSYKVKRLRRSSRARVAACDVRGKVHGPWHDAECVLVHDPALEERAYAALRRKYGVQMWLADVGATLRRSKARRQVLRVTFPAP